MNIEELQKFRKILILGYGKEGMSTEKFLKKFVPDSQIIITDKQDGDNYLSKQVEADLVIKSPSILPNLITKPYTTATNIFFANTKNKTIGITGTKGKSTTSTLLDLVLKEAGIKSFLIGNIGKPALSVLMDDHDINDIFIVELSSYQLADCRYSPHIGVFLNIYHDHNDYHQSFENYYQAKTHITTFSNSEDYFVFNPSQQALSDLADKTKAKRVPFVDALPFEIQNERLKGEHNRDNVRAVETVSNILGIKSKIVEQACNKYQGLSHRMEIVGTFRSIIFIDDGAATTPEATIYALETIQNVDTLFVGGLNRGYDFVNLSKTIARFNVQNIVFFPDSGDAILAQLEKDSYKPKNILQTSSMTEAVQFAYQHTRPNHVCLLSSASPSYSLWKNWDEKGIKYKEAILKL